MKHILIITLFVFTLNSCTSNEYSDEKVSTTKDLVNEVPFSGYWLKNEYHEEIKENKSPRDAQEHGEMIYIPDSTNKTTRMIYNFHEASAELTVLKNLDNYELWTIENDSLLKKQALIRIVNNTEIIIENRTFVKVNPVSMKNETLLLEEILFGGTYTDEKNSIIEFKRNGKIRGLNNFQHYKPMIDYFDEGRDVNQIEFWNQEEKINLGFIFDGDTLNLFELDCLTEVGNPKRCVEVENGSIVHKIWRIK